MYLSVVMDHISHASVIILSMVSHRHSGPHSLCISVTILSVVSLHFEPHIPHASVTILSAVSLHCSGPHSLRASVTILSTVSFHFEPHIPHASVMILSTVSLHSGFCVVIPKHSVLICIHHTIGDLVDGYLYLMGRSHRFKKLHN